MGGSCLILVLTNVIGHPRRADAKNDFKNYQGPTIRILSEKMRFENTFTKFFLIWSRTDFKTVFNFYQGQTIILP